MTRSVTNRITELLQEKKMTQKQLAQASGMTESAVSHYVKGDRVPRGVNLKKIANALGTTTDDLLGHEGVPDKEDDLKVVKNLIARNAATMSKAEKMELLSILFDQD